jgi:hypothetical protein
MKGLQDCLPSFTGSIPIFCGLLKINLNCLNTLPKGGLEELGSGLKVRITLIDILLLGFLATRRKKRIIINK